SEGRVELDAPVRRYVPELRLSDEQAAAQVTVLNLLNHTAGLDWALIVDTGDGDDALATHVAKDGRAGRDRTARRAGLLQSGGVQPGRADHREGHGPDVRGGRRLARLR